MKRSTIGLVGAAAAGALFLAGCGSSGGTAASSTSTPATTSAMSSSMMSSPSSSMSSSEMSMTDESMPSSDATTVGGDVTELDAQSVAFFQVACGGIAGLQDLGNVTQGSSNPAEVGQAFAAAGDKMIATGQQLATTPPPTFEGGDQLAANLTSGLDEFGSAIKEFGTQTAALDPNDPNSQQKFLTGLQDIGQKVQSVGQRFELSDSVKAAAEKQVPECAALSKTTSSSAGASAAPSS